MKYSLIGLAIAACGLAAAPLALAQSAAPPPAASVAPAYGDLESFVKTLATPSVRIGRIGRWADPICPMTAGIPAQYAAMVDQRVRQVATMVGAHVADDKCVTNVTIVFTNTAQAFMDKLTVEREDLLGYHNTLAQAQELAKVSHPIQAWYETSTRDAHGMLAVDLCTDCAGAKRAEAMAFNPTNMEEGLRTEFTMVTIVVDTAKVNGTKLNTVADYAALLALSDATISPDCGALPSISNLFSSGCAPGLKVDALTPDDVAYLKALYIVDDSNGLDLNLQRDAIVRQMQKELASR